jgi:hypothetical protein
MEGLMHFCQNWGHRGCHPEIAKLKNPPEIQSNGKIPIWPVRSELKKLAELCMKCDGRYLIADEMECPYCDCRSIEITGGAHQVMGFPLARGYKCLSCEGIFWIYERK